MLFQKRVVYNKLDIYVFIVNSSIIPGDVIPEKRLYGLGGCGV